MDLKKSGIAAGPQADGWVLSDGEAGQDGEVARLIYAALSDWYGRHLNQPEKFGAAWEPFLVFPETYQALDPGCAMMARDEASGEIGGICFYHPRATHVSIGIVAVHPDWAGRGVARAMVEAVCRRAEKQGLPVRLVSSLMNLDSFSLYTRLGFVPGAVYQDLQFPPGRLPEAEDNAGRVRRAEASDLEALVALERELTGLDRRRDLEFFLTNADGTWTVLLLEASGGPPAGYLAACQSSRFSMLGPGAMRGEAEARALIAKQLAFHAPERPVVLVPSRATGLIQWLYAAGARNLELHVAQVCGARPDQAGQSGVVVPTFLPESG